MSKSALVTGASGFVGAAVARLLVNKGFTTKVLLRQSSSMSNIEGLQVEVAIGDLKDLQSLKVAVQGCDYLFHVAADYRLWALNPNELYQNNVQGTENMMKAALESGVQRVVYTSSVATLGLNHDSSPANEDTPVSFRDMIGDYKKSKYLAEEKVQELIKKENLPAVIVNPSTPVGPGDIKPTPTGKLIVDAASGKMPAYVDTGLNWVHVDDVAEGHYLALEKGEIGERYILGNENLSLKELLTKIARIRDKPAPKVKIPHNIVLPIAYISEGWARLTHSKKEPMATVNGVKLSKKKMYFSIEKARSKLGFNPRKVDVALEDAISWFTIHQYIR